MNFFILRQEIEGLIETIEFHKDAGIILSKEFLSVRNVEHNKKEGGVDSAAHHRPVNVLYKKVTPASFPSYEQSSKPLKDKTPEDKSERSRTIISLLKTGVELTIKDITSHFKGISEKTVQRELLSMVAQGILKKKGERRWSRYSLK